MGRIRPFEESDIPKIIDLNTRLFPGSSGLSPSTQRKKFGEICFHSPWQNGAIRSLVYENGDNDVVGFLGITPRTMCFRGQRITVAIGQHLMVDPKGRSAFASVDLFRAFLSGPQDLSMADMAVDITRRIWERLGGSTSLINSIYWRHALLPSRFILAAMKKKRYLRFLATIGMPLSLLLDLAATRTPMSPFRQFIPKNREEPLDNTTLFDCITRFAAQFALHPHYEPESLGWLMSRLEEETRFGKLEKILVRNDRNEVLGWYIYYLRPGGSSEVLQIGATEGSVSCVIDHLFHHAWQHGSVEVIGRLDPAFMHEFSHKYCIFMPGRNWMLVHAKDPEILHAINAGNAFLTRLEGDLWFF